MARIEESIEVDAPISTVYNQWTQFEEFPRFMGGVESVRQLDDKTLHWIASIAGVTREWDARIVDQEPDQRIAWENTTGATNRGVVTFRPLDTTRTEVNLELEFEGEGFVEKVGEKLGLVEGQAKADLERFKEFMEARQVETGGWRGDLDEADQVRGN